MTPYQFWHEDMSLFVAYQKAYLKKQYEVAWLTGLYVDKALQIELANMWKKKGDKPLMFPDKPNDPFAEKEKPLTESERNDRADEIMLNQTNWLKNRFKK